MVLDVPSLPSPTSSDNEEEENDELTVNFDEPREKGLG
jgi:hypothetical protein